MTDHASKPADVESAQLKAAILHLADHWSRLSDQLFAQSERAPAGSVQEASSATTQVMLYEQNAMALRFLLEHVEALDAGAKDRRIIAAAQEADRRAAAWPECESKGE